MLVSILAATGQESSLIRLDSAQLALKSVNAVRCATPPRIDGHPSDPVWNSAPVAGQFVEYAPRNGTLPALTTEIRFLYDDNAVYILAVMFDPNPDSICREMGRRDQIEMLNNDYISFDILPYNDGLNMYEFKVSPANIQNDCKYSAIGQDLTWDAVWESAALTTDSAWIAEVKIPWSALRFPKTSEQVWGINMWRNIQRYGEYSTWSWVDNKTDNIFRYYGTVTGIRDIRPPVRLSVSPYLSGYLEKLPENKSWDYFMRGGLDLRYGINESYTLDMMLIPDFGQVQSDDQILNLSPFEIRYDEKRQFFTEGTELFEKCEIFYTRRVGSAPKNYDAAYDNLKVNEIVSENPDQTRIVNATKISGRNAKGFGVGFFNGMTLNTYAELSDTISGESRRIMTQPFTNYNVLVFDQNLKNNSYVTLINTNYWTPSSRYVANVTGTEANIKNRKNTIGVFGRFNLSQKYLEGINPDFGYQYVLSIEKPSGKFQYDISREVLNDTYDPNDMGFLPYNNEVSNSLQLSWREMDPKGKILNHQTFFNVEYVTLFKPDKFKTLDFSVNNNITFKNFWSNSLGISCQPLGYDDYYEPREWGRVYKKPLNYSADWSLATDGRKPFRYQHAVGFTNSPENDNFGYYFRLIPRFRISDRISATLQIGYEQENNNYGWIPGILSDSAAIWFGCRDITTFNNILTVRYIFSTKASLSLRARHYWLQARYSSVYTLQEDGSLAEAPFIEYPGINFNTITADLQFVWYFAPGSEISVVWKNLTNTISNQPEDNYFRNLGNTLGAEQANSFSVRILYYLDFLSLRKLKRG